MKNRMKKGWREYSEKEEDENENDDGGSKGISPVSHQTTCCNKVIACVKCVFAGSVFVSSSVFLRRDSV